MLRTLFFVLTFAPWTIFCLLLGLPLSFWGPDRYHRVGILWGRVGLLLAGVKLQVEGRDRIPRDRPVIFMPNHQSNFDILALYPGLNRQFRWLAKEELFRLPLLGLAMKRSGYIPVNRSDRTQAIRSMKEAARRIAAGVSVIIFPEGTRSSTCKLLPFKKGGFMLALEAQVPIVPVAILDSRRIMPKHSPWIRAGTIHLRILPAVATVGKGVQDRDDLMQQVRQPIAAALRGA